MLKSKGERDSKVRVKLTLFTIQLQICRAIGTLRRDLTTKTESKGMKQKGVCSQNWGYSRINVYSWRRGCSRWTDRICIRQVILINKKMPLMQFNRRVLSNKEPSIFYSYTKNVLGYSSYNKIINRRIQLLIKQPKGYSTLQKLCNRGRMKLQLIGISAFNLSTLRNVVSKK